MDRNLEIILVRGGLVSVDESYIADAVAGVPLHPSFRSLVPLLDAFSSELPDGALPVLLSPPYVVPSTPYTAAECSSSLLRHLLSLISPATPALNDKAPSHDRDTTVTSKGIGKPDPALLSGKDPPKGPDPAALFLGMPAVNLNVTKWNWSGYMTFGRAIGKKNPTGEKNPIPASFMGPPENAHVGPAQEVVVDKNALEDAISEHISITISDLLDEHAQHTSGIATRDDVVDPPEPNGFQTSHERIPADSGSASPIYSVTAVPSEPPQLEFSSRRVYLAKSSDTLTVPQKVFYLLVSSPKNLIFRKM